MRTHPKTNASVQAPVQVMDYVHALRLGHTFEIPIVPTYAIRSASHIAKLERKLPYPWVMKAVGRYIVHKVDMGGVKLNIRNTNEAIMALHELRKIHGVEYLVAQPMRKGVELIVGGKWDAQFGPTVLVGMGGIYTNTFKDSALRIAPVRDSDIAEMIQELKIYPVLKGIHGQEGINIGQLHQIIKNVSRLMMKGTVAELDLNPILATADKVEAVDIRIIERK